MVIQHRGNIVSNEQSQRIRALKVYEILCQETDQDNPLGTTLLISKLKLSGIECDRKTLYKDIKSMVVIITQNVDL